jgi:hypothetical protein
MIASLIENGLVLLVIFRVKAVRTSINMVIGSLAFADITVNLLFGIYGIGRSHGQNYILGSFACENEHFMKSAALFVRQSSVIGMVIGRLWSVRNRSNELTKSSLFSCLLLTIMWCLSWSLSFVVHRRIWENKLVFIEQSAEYHCMERDHGGPTYFAVNITLAIYLPILLLLIFYATVWYLSRRIVLLNSNGEPIAAPMISNKILLLYIVIALTMQIPAQMYMISRMMDDKQEFHQVNY